MLTTTLIDAAFAMPAVPSATRSDFASFIAPASAWHGSNHLVVSSNPANYTNYTTQKFAGYGNRGVWNSID